MANKMLIDATHPEGPGWSCCAQRVEIDFETAHANSFAHILSSQVTRVETVAQAAFVEYTATPRLPAFSESYPDYIISFFRSPTGSIDRADARRPRATMTKRRSPSRSNRGNRAAIAIASVPHAAATNPFRAPLSRPLSWAPDDPDYRGERRGRSAPSDQHSDDQHSVSRWSNRRRKSRTRTRPMR